MRSVPSFERIERRLLGFVTIQVEVRKLVEALDAAPRAAAP
jgi:hypothetical protein